MADNSLERVFYYDGEFLTTNDYQAEQLYGINKRRVFNRYMYTWGIVGGLTPSVASSKLIVEEGFALDSEGREIYYDGSFDAVSSLTGDAGSYYLTISYGESNGHQQTKRIVERPTFDYYLEGEAFDDSVDLILAQFTIDSNGALSPTLDTQKRTVCRSRVIPEKI